MLTRTRTINANPPTTTCWQQWRWSYKGGIGDEGKLRDIKEKRVNPKKLLDLRSREKSLTEKEELLQAKKSSLWRKKNITIKVSPPHPPPHKSGKNPRASEGKEERRLGFFQKRERVCVYISQTVVRESDFV